MIQWQEVSIQSESGIN